MSNTKQIKVILMLAGYLFVVLSHIAFVRPHKISGASGSLLVAKSHDKFGKGIINVKHIYKTVINREFSDKKVDTPAELYIATLLYDVSWNIFKAENNHAYQVPLTQLPVKRSYHLRI